VEENHQETRIAWIRERVLDRLPPDSASLGHLIQPLLDSPLDSATSRVRDCLS
jgi:hypothetical protein